MSKPTRSSLAGFLQFTGTALTLLSPTVFVLGVAVYETSPWVIPFSVQMFPAGMSLVVVAKIVQCLHECAYWLKQIATHGIVVRRNVVPQEFENVP